MSTTALPSSLADYATVLTQEYNAECDQTTYRATQLESLFPIHTSDIPAVDHISQEETLGIVKSASCSAPQINDYGRNLVQAQGQINLNLGMFSYSYSADRRLYHVTVPVSMNVGPGPYALGLQAYRLSCEELKGSVETHQNSTLFAYCSEPSLETDSKFGGGSQYLVGEFHALVFAYAPPTLKTSLQAGAAACAAFLASEQQRLGPDLAMGFCAPSALQSTCYTLEQKYHPASIPGIQCQATTTVNGKPWNVWASYEDQNGDATLDIHVKTDLGTGQESMNGTFQPGAQTGSGVLTAPFTKGSSIVLTVKGATGTLAGGNLLFLGLPASLPMTCSATP